jgi:hypothetical protein
LVASGLLFLWLKKHQLFGAGGDDHLFGGFDDDRIVGGGGSEAITYLVILVMVF